MVKLGTIVRADHVDIETFAINDDETLDQWIVKNCKRIETSKAPEVYELTVQNLTDAFQFLHKNNNSEAAELVIKVITNGYMNPGLDYYYEREERDE